MFYPLVMILTQDCAQEHRYYGRIVLGSITG